MPRNPKFRVSARANILFTSKAQFFNLFYFVHRKRSKCYQDEFDYAYGKCAEFKATMSLKVGQCTTASVITTIEQGLVTCNWDWLTKQQTKF